MTFTGEVYGWGSDLDDQLGLGGRAVGVNDSQRWPQLIGAPKPYGENEDMLPVRQVSAGKHHSVILTESGEVFAMGSNEFGQLGIESSTGLPEDAIEGTPIPASVDSFNVVTEPYLQSFTVKELKAKLERRGESTVGSRRCSSRGSSPHSRSTTPSSRWRRGMHTLARTASGSPAGVTARRQARHGDEDDCPSRWRSAFRTSGRPVSGSDLV